MWRRRRRRSAAAQSRALMTASSIWIGKKDLLTRLALPLEACFNLVRNPLAANRVLRQDRQQLVVDADGFVDLAAEIVAWLEALRREPAADAAALYDDQALRGTRPHQPAETASRFRSRTWQDPTLSCCRHRY